MIRVTNRTRWNRTKGFTAFACFIASIVAVGGLEDEHATQTSNFPVAIGLLACCALIMSTIYRRR
jgi:hypothetical protein